MALLTGGTATWTTSGSVLTVSTVDLSSVLANMTVGFVNTDGSTDKMWRIVSVTPSGTSGGSITVSGTLPTYSSSTAIIVDTLTFNGTGASLANAMWVNVTNAITAMLGAGFAADASSRVLELAKTTSGALGRIIWKISTTAQFMISQEAVSSVERWILKYTSDGSTWANVFSVRKDTGAIEFSTAATFSAGMNGALAPFRNRIINGDFRINQRVVSGTVSLSAGVYGHDRWKGGASGATYTFATSAGLTTLTISANTLRQEIESIYIDGTSYVLSWTGTATARVWQGSAAGSYAASPIVVTGLTAATNTVIEFSTGTVTKVQFEPGAVATAYEFRPFGIEYALCQRYYFKTYPHTTAPGTAGSGGLGGVSSAAGYFMIPVVFPVPMRASPTMTYYGLYGTSSGKYGDGGSASDNDIGGSATISTTAATAYATNALAGSFIYLNAVASAEI